MNRIAPVGFFLIAWFTAGCSDNGGEPFTGSGTIEATEITVSAKTQGEVLDLSFREGDNVQKGDTLAVIEVEQIQLQRDAAAAGLDELDWSERILKKEMETALETIEQASIALENIGKNRDRIFNLVKENAATQEQYDTVDTEYRLATSRLEASKKQLESMKTRLGSFGATRGKIEANLRLFDSRIEDGAVTSPASGVLIEKFIEQGETVNAGTPFCTIADLSTVRLTIYVGEDQLGRVSLGDNAVVNIDSHPDREFEGTITWISQQAEFTPKNVQTRESRVDLVYAVEITIDNSEGVFKIGMPADAYIEGLESL